MTTERASAGRRRNRPKISACRRSFACEEYCRRQGYEVVERFHEEGESAKSTDRSQLQNLLTFCRLNKGRVRPTRQTTLPVVVNAGGQRRCRFANAQPDPDFRYRSNASARDSSVN
jgi:resolvase-like protein